MKRRNKKPSLHSSLIKTRVALVAACLTLAGILLIVLGNWLGALPLGAMSWLVSAIGEVGGILLAAGLIGSLFEYAVRRTQLDLIHTVVGELVRRILREEAGTIKDAVVNGFAIQPEDLKRVATPELLDTIATNAMALRLGDEQFARELYAEVRDQGIRAAERWHDVEVSVRLSSALERSAKGAPLFDVTVEWQYTTVPSHSVRRFACVSDRDEYNELVTDMPSTSTWFMRSRPGMDASSRECYELLSFTVDGEPRSIRRTGRKTGQTYSVTIGDNLIAAGKPVRIRHVYRTVTSQAGHWLFFEIPQPSKNLSLRFDYTNTEIASLRTIDLLPGHATQLATLPSTVNGREVSVDVPGWLLPRAGLAFVWTLSSEEQAAETTHARAA